MESFSATLVDAYAHHLSEVNEKTPVSACEDIRNDKGSLVVEKGTQIDRILAARIVRHKLVKPLEQSVGLDDEISGDRLKRLFAEQLFDTFPDCRSLHYSRPLQVRLEMLCQLYGSYPLLRQKLTVQSIQRPQDFQKSLFCAWLSMAMAHCMKWQPGRIEAAFLAGLMHDSGMLHIDPQILNKKEQLSADEWRAIQSHPVIAAEFLKQVPELSPLVARATREHHERRDGSGYPFGSFDESLSSVGQLVALADSVCAIRLQQFSSNGGTLANLLPIIQFNARNYDDETYRTLFKLIRGADIQLGRLLSGALEQDLQQLETVIDKLLSVQSRLTECFKPLAQVMGQLPQESDNHHIRSAVQLIQGCWFSVASSGLLTPALRQWLEGAKLEVDLPQTEEVQIMLKELHWQLVQIRKALVVLKEQVRKVPRSMDRAIAALDGLDQVYAEGPAAQTDSGKLSEAASPLVAS